MIAEDKIYDFYLVHAPGSARLAGEIEESLQSSGLICFNPHRELSFDLGYFGGVQRAIRSSRCVVVVFSEDSSLYSKTILMELGAAISEGLTIFSLVSDPPPKYVPEALQKFPRFQWPGGFKSLVRQIRKLSTLQAV